MCWKRQGEGPGNDTKEATQCHPGGILVRQILELGCKSRSRYDNADRQATTVAKALKLDASLIDLTRVREA
jgi:hypothetical protein